MSNLASLAYAAAFMVVALALFAIVRRIMHSPATPHWLTASAVAFALAFGMTVLFALSLFNLANAIQIQGPSVVLAGLISVGLHALTWAIVRKIIPIKGGDKDPTPHADLTGGGVPTAG